MQRFQMVRYVASRVCFVCVCVCVCVGGGGGGGYLIRYNYATGTTGYNMRHMVNPVRRVWAHMIHSRVVI